ncbi:MAG TPA: HAD-IA family hydrolase [Actinomycetota bacterium]|nr:HAD-IA family hydrolase [Actinomycetota bacterium]
MIEAVFFDAGQTLLRAEPSYPELAAQVYRSRGHHVDSDDIVRVSRELGSHFRDAADRGWVFSATAEDSHRFWTAFYRDQMERLGIDDPDSVEVLYETFSDVRSYGLYDDVVEVLVHLRDEGFRLGIISNFEAWLDPLLDHLGIKHIFEVVAISGPLAVEKPDPKIFAWAVEQMGLPAEASAHVGDQPFFDAEAAIACGLHGILLDRYGQWADLEVTYPKITTLRDLPSVLDR